MVVFLLVLVKYLLSVSRITVQVLGAAYAGCDFWVSSTVCEIIFFFLLIFNLPVELIGFIRIMTKRVTATRLPSIMPRPDLTRTRVYTFMPRMHKPGSIQSTMWIRIFFDGDLVLLYYNIIIIKATIMVQDNDGEKSYGEINLWCIKDRRLFMICNFVIICIHCIHQIIYFSWNSL